MQRPQNPDESFTYDKVGNRETSHLSASHTHNDINQLIQDDQYDYTYDADGNLTSKTDRSTSETTTYTFDAENSLTRIDLPDTTIVTYAYDPMGRRIEKNVDGTVTRYIYDGANILLELDGTNAVRAYYTHGSGIDEPLVMKRDTNSDGSLDQKVFYHADGLGSIKTLTDDTGVIVQTYLYDSFGNLVAQTGAINNPYTYTAREFDSESGLYYYRARYYDAKIGRFLSEDKANISTLLQNLIKKGSCQMGEIRNQGLSNKNLLQNLFSYVQNNPINFSDPTGNFTCPSGIWRGWKAFAVVMWGKNGQAGVKSRLTCDDCPITCKIHWRCKNLRGRGLDVSGGIFTDSWFGINNTKEFWKGREMTFVDVMGLPSLGAGIGGGWMKGHCTTTSVSCSKN